MYNTHNTLAACSGCSNSAHNKDLAVLQSPILCFPNLCAHQRVSRCLHVSKRCLGAEKTVPPTRTHVFLPKRSKAKKLRRQSGPFGFSSGLSFIASPSPVLDMPSLVVPPPPVLLAQTAISSYKHIPIHFALRGRDATPSHRTWRTFSYVLLHAKCSARGRPLLPRQKRCDLIVLYIAALS